MLAWTNARIKVDQGSAQEDVRDIFAGTSAWDRATIGNVAVTRLSVVAHGTQTVPPSFAVVGQADWTEASRPELPCNIRWQQSKEARYDVFFDLPERVRCLGLGERFSGLNLRGSVHTLCTTDTGGDQHETIDSLYMSIPFLILQDGAGVTGIFVDCPAPQKWDLDSLLEERANVKVFTRRGWQMYVFEANDLPSLISAYTTLTGVTELPPVWALGHQQSRWSYPDQNTAQRIAQEFRSRNIPCDTIVLDIDYMDEYRVFTTSPDRFPNFKEMVQALNAQKFRVVTIVDPGVKKDGKYSIYKEGLKQDLFCKKADGSLFIDVVWPGKSAFPDFAKPETRLWWGEKQNHLLDLGVSGIWNDMNEPAFFSNKSPLPKNLTELPPDKEQFFMQQSPEGKPIGHFELRNLYGSLMSQAAREGLQKRNPQERPFVLSRAGYAGLQRHAAIWLGDNMSWFDHLETSIPMLINVGLSGVPFAGADIGGFGADTTAEMLIRWYELGIFYPFFRNHCIMQGRAQEPWAFTPAVEQAIKKLIETRYALLPYIQALFWDHMRTGAPLIRPLSWHYPSDPQAAHVQDQFLFGEDLLVAPVVQKARAHRYVYLPKGNWHPFEGGDPLEGGRVYTIEWKLGSVPAFVRDGAIIPLAQVVQSTVDLPHAAMTFRAFGDRATGRYFEDDGISISYKSGSYNEFILATNGSQLEVNTLHSGFEAPSRKYYLKHNDTIGEVQIR
jgi:alpha-glucosidase